MTAGFSRSHLIMAWLAIGIVAFACRFWHLDSIPYGIFNDEAVNGNDAPTTLATGEYKPFYPANYGREGLFVWLLAAVLSVLKPSILALRLVPAMAGTLTVMLLPAAIYALARFIDPEFTRSNRLLVIVVALASMFFLATSYWHLNFSRTAFRAILDPGFAVASVMLVSLALSRPASLLLPLLAGSTCGLGLYGYGSYKFMLFPLGFLVILALLRNRASLDVTRSLVLMIAGFLPVAWPLLAYIAAAPEAYFGRLSAVGVFSTDAPLQHFLQSLGVSIGILLFSGDPNPRHDLAAQPLLSQLLYLFFIIGLLFSARHLLRPATPGPLAGATQLQRPWILSSFLLVWLASMLIPPAMTVEKFPHVLRAIGAIPPVMIIAGLGAGVVVALVRAQGNAALHKAGLAGGALVMAIMVAATWNDYFRRFPNNPGTPPAFGESTYVTALRLRQSDTATPSLLVTDASDDWPALWSIQPLLFMTGNDPARHNVRIVRIDNLPAQPDLAGSRIFAPEHLEQEITPLLAAGQEVHYYKINR